MWTFIFVFMIYDMIYLLTAIWLSPGGSSTVHIYTQTIRRTRQTTTYINIFIFKDFKSVDHRTIQINHQPDATFFQFIILMFIYSSTCFGRFPAHRQELDDCSGSLWFYLRIVVTVVLCSWSGRLAATAVTELLMMGGKTPETC